MSPANLYQLKIWPKTHLMNKSVQQGLFFWPCWKSLCKLCARTGWHLRHLRWTLSDVSYLCLCFCETAGKVKEKSARKTELLMCRSSWCFFFCAQRLLEVGSEVDLKRAGGVSLCSWESALNLKQNFFLAEDGGVNKKCIRQTFCSAVILGFVHLRANKLLSLEVVFFSEAVTWQFSRGKNIHCDFFLSRKWY